MTCINLSLMLCFSVYSCEPALSTLQRSAFLTIPCDAISPQRSLRLPSNTSFYKTLLILYHGVIFTFTASGWMTAFRRPFPPSEHRGLVRLGFGARRRRQDGSGGWDASRILSFMLFLRSHLRLEEEKKIDGGKIYRILMLYENKDGRFQTPGWSRLEPYRVLMITFCQMEQKNTEMQLQIAAGMQSENWTRALLTNSTVSGMGGGMWAEISKLTPDCRKHVRENPQECTHTHTPEKPHRFRRMQSTDFKVNFG